MEGFSVSELQVIKVELGVKLVVPVSTLQKHLPAPIDKLGLQIANEVDKRVARKALGYYPAIEYFIAEQDFPGYLLDALQEVSELAVDIVAQSVNELLVPIFSSAQLNNIQCLAYSLPSVRPGKPSSVEQLAKHFTPNAVKFELIVSVLKKHPGSEGIEKYADNTVHRWLSEVFSGVEIFSSRLIS